MPCLGEQVVAHVRVRDVVKHAIQHKAERPVDRAQRAAQPRPLGTAEMRHKHISVLQIGDEDEVKVDNQVGDKVEAEDGEQAKRVAAPREGGARAGERNVGLNDQPVLFGRKEDGGRRKVIRVLAAVPAMMRENNAKVPECERTV